MEIYDKERKTYGKMKLDFEIERFKQNISDDNFSLLKNTEIGNGYKQALFVLKQEKKNIEIDIKKLESNCKIDDSEINSLKKELRAINVEKDSLIKTTKDRVTKKAIKFENKDIKLKDKTVALKDNIENSKDKISNIESKIELTKVKISNLETIKDKINVKCDFLSDKIERLSKENDDLKLNIETVKGKVEELKLEYISNKYSGEKDSRIEKMSELKKEISSLEKESFFKKVTLFKQNFEKTFTEARNKIQDLKKGNISGEIKKNIETKQSFEKAIIGERSKNEKMLSAENNSNLRSIEMILDKSVIDFKKFDFNKKYSVAIDKIDQLQKKHDLISERIEQVLESKFDVLDKIGDLYEQKNVLVKDSAFIKNSKGLFKELEKQEKTIVPFSDVVEKELDSVEKLEIDTDETEKSDSIQEIEVINEHNDNTEDKFIDEANDILSVENNDENNYENENDLDTDTNEDLIVDTVSNDNDDEYNVEK